MNLRSAIRDFFRRRTPQAELRAHLKGKTHDAAAAREAAGLNEEPDRNDPRRGRRAPRHVFFWNLDIVRQFAPKKANAFRMRGGGVYGFQLHQLGPDKGQPTGAFIRLDKDRRPVKERKRARREARGLPVEKALEALP